MRSVARWVALAAVVLGLGSACAGCAPVPIGVLGILLDHPTGNAPITNVGLLGWGALLTAYVSVPAGVAAAALLVLPGGLVLILDRLSPEARSSTPTDPAR